MIGRRPRAFPAVIGSMIAVVVSTTLLTAQSSTVRYGTRVPSDVRLIYERGVDFLVRAQGANGAWDSQAGINGLCLMALLASGDDPNFGRHSITIRKSVRQLLRSQSKNGFFPTSMYNHGFAMLALAEAYGAVDESLLGSDDLDQRSIGEALQRAVRCSVEAQKNNTQQGWRYAPDAKDADTSVSGAVLVGLLAVRNAGIAVPEESIESALAFYQRSTRDGGQVAYAGSRGHGSINLSAVANLVYALGKKKEWREFEATRAYLVQQRDQPGTSHPFYYRYYMAQALFQSDFDAWTAWDLRNTRELKAMQASDGSFQSNHGPSYGTAMSLLSLALHFRFLPIYER